MSANTSGGVCGKMISPSRSPSPPAPPAWSVESEIFRFTFKHSIFHRRPSASCPLLWAYVFPGIVPILPNRLLPP